MDLVVFKNVEGKIDEFLNTSFFVVFPAKYWFNFFENDQK